MLQFPYARHAALLFTLQSSNAVKPGNSAIRGALLRLGWQ